LTRARNRVEGLRDGGAVPVIHQQFRRLGGLRAVEFANALAAVQRGPVLQQPELAIRGFRHFGDAEEAAHRHGARLLDDVVVGEKDERDHRGQGQGCTPEQHACDQEGAEGPVKDRLRQHDRIEHGDDQDQRRGREPAEQQDAPTASARQREAGPAQERKRQQDRILRHPIEHVGRDQPRRDAADHAAGGHPEVEAGEISRRRTRARQLAMAHQRVDEEHHEMNREQPEDRLERIEDQHPRRGR